jgi:hypothetical protein
MKIPVRCYKCNKLVGYEERLPGQFVNVIWTICQKCLKGVGENGQKDLPT